MQKKKRPSNHVLTYRCVYLKRAVDLYIKRNAKKNIILRPRDENSVQISMPAWLSDQELFNWLRQHETLLVQCLKFLNITQPTQQLPKWIWWLGSQVAVRVDKVSQVELNQAFYLPEQWPFEQQMQQLRQFLLQSAQVVLLNKLAQHSKRMNLYPVSSGLSYAKTFWGVCRQSTGIRLNWRLIGSPDWVQDYVCIHELCHLEYPNHSHQFWQCVQKHFAPVKVAKNWLKQYGQELFIMDTTS